ncbi:MAG: sigma-70 family RNA polymerase sigma factor [Acidimicrobiia bacterium]|nr:sigma-70 family RNA polymerase sigma factor [Acidimicrobiia bacterium]
MSHSRVLDDRLVDGVRARSEKAFAAVYQLLASDLLSFANGMLRDIGAAEDAVQQAFLELARAAPTIKGDARSLRAWLYRSVRFSCLDEIRRRKRRPERPTSELPEVGVDDNAFHGDPSLQDSLSRLSERHRTILILRHVIGFSVDEIARILDTNRTSVYAASARAERRLRRELANVESRGSAASQPEGTPTSREPS